MSSVTLPFVAAADGSDEINCCGALGLAVALAAAVEGAMVVGDGVSPQVGWVDTVGKGVVVVLIGAVVDGVGVGAFELYRK